MYFYVHIIYKIPGLISVNLDKKEEIAICVLLSPNPLHPKSL